MYRCKLWPYWVFVFKDLDLMKSILTICLNPALQKTLVFADYIPDTVNRAILQRLDAAGKGINVSRVLTQLGKNSMHLTQLGGSFRPIFLEQCVQDGLKIEWVESRSSIRFCYTIINKKDKSVTELVEEGEEVEAKTGDRLLEAYKKLLPDVSTVVISGSKAAGFSDSFISEMVCLAKARSLRVILDIRGKDLLECLPWKPDIIKPNLVEFASTFAPGLVAGSKIKTINSAEDLASIKIKIMEICGDLYNKYQSQIILSQGSNAIWYMENGMFAEFEVDPVEPVNTIGSGDAFTAGLASALDEGRALREAVAEGARCGRLNALLLRPGVIR